MQDSADHDRASTAPEHAARPLSSSSPRARPFIVIGVVLVVAWAAGFWWLFANPTDARQRASDAELQAQIEAAIAQVEAQPKRSAASREQRRRERNDLIARLKRVSEMTPDERQQIIDDYAAKLAMREIANTDLIPCNLIVREFRQVGDYKLAAAAHRRFADVLLETGNLHLYFQASLMQGAARQLELFEKPMKLAGITTGGKPFDWQQYRGKIVLVEVWAIACPGCRELVPFMKENYAKYHDRGFEIVGVCLDKNRQQVTNYVRKNKIPWTTVLEAPQAPPQVVQVSGAPPIGGPENDENRPVPFAPAHYGIVATPTMLLLDKEGKLLSMNVVDGESLTRELAAIFENAPKERGTNSGSESNDSGE